MIKKRLQLITSEDGSVAGQFFNSWKELHIHLFEHGLYEEFQIIDQTGDTVLHYIKKDGGKYELKFSEKVPGSVLFEIVNRHASAHL